MLYRKIEPKLQYFLEKSPRALLVDGARQVGKTFSIRKALRDSGMDYVEINLLKNPEFVPLLNTVSSVDDLIVNLTAALNRKITAGSTVIFIDEVQAATEIVTNIKFCVDDGRFKFVLSGSLLGVELAALRSVPVGYLDELVMYPLDFEEFLIASGVVDDTVAHLRNCFETEAPVGDLIHQTMMRHFHRYLVVGGMPAAVAEYVATGDMNVVSQIQNDIYNQYILDFSKYEERNRRLMLKAVYDAIPSQLLKQNKRFNYSDVQKGLRSEKVSESFLWLTAAGVAIPTYNCTEPRVALKQNEKSSLLKLYMNDVGLLTVQYGNAMRLKILAMDTRVNLGGIFENAVAQQLNAHGFRTYFYNSHKNGELDFLVEFGDEVVPIEIKSGKDYYVHSAMDKAVSNPEYDIKRAFVFANSDISRDGKIVYMPVYMSTFLADDEELPILRPEDI